MTTLAELRGILRTRLGDTVEPYTWPNTALNSAIVSAIKDYSRHFPRRVEATAAGQVGVNDYALGGEVRKIAWLRCPDTYQGTRKEISWEETLSRDISQEGYRLFAFWDGDTKLLRLVSAPSSDADVIRYGYETYHALPTEDTDVLTVKAEDEELLLLYAHAMAIVPDTSGDATLSRWDETSGRRDDNPVLRLHSELLREYQEKVQERLASVRGGSSLLRRVRVDTRDWPL